MTVSEIVAEAERDLVFFDESGGGVTFTGGEPFAQPELLEALLHACRARRIHTTIETCGAAARESMLRIAALADLILYDLKILDAARHRQYTGASNRNILENLEALVAAGRPVTIRIPIVPGVNDDPAGVRAACDYLSKLRVTRVDLLPYHAAGAEKYRRLGREYRMEQTEAPTGDAMAAIAAQMAAAGIPVENRRVKEHLMTERVARLRACSLETKPWLSLERARLLTEFYRTCDAALSIPVRRALSLAIPDGTQDDLHRRRAS